MGSDAWLTLAVIAVLVVAMATERVPPAIAMGCGVITLYLTGVVDASEAFSGFSNLAPITVAALYVLAGAAEITGALSGLTTRTLGGGTNHSARRTLARFVFPVVAASGLVANTPLVAMLAPRITSWARRSGRSPSRFLIPLSYAAVLGGVITVLGTSTNLVVSGLLDDAGEKPLGVFEITPVGLPVALIGGAVLVLVTPWLLRDRESPGEDLASAREFTVELVVAAGGPIAGQSVAGAGLRNLQGVYLVEILRNERTMAPVAPDEVLEDDDRLVFAGAVERVVDLQSQPGLVMAEEHHFAASGDIGHRFFEVVVAPGSMLNGSTLKAVEFRSAFGAAVIAVHRSGHRLTGKLGDLPLRDGDVLLLVAPEGFRSVARHSSAFSVVAPLLEGAPPLRRRSARLVELATLAVVLLAGTGIVDLTKAALGVVLGLLVLRVITPSEARRSINLDVIAMIAFSFGLGAAAATSGLAQTVADGLVSFTSAYGDIGIVLAVALGTLVATELLSNNAAAAIMFPVAGAIAAETGLQVRPLAIVILMMASCSFLTPIGYQTNTMVFAMGGYRFSDFTKVGIPISIAAVTVTVVAVPLVFNLR